MPIADVRLTVVGIGADGWAGLGDNARSLLIGADTVVGAPRHLGLLPEVDGQQRLTLPRPLLAGLTALLENLSGRVVVLASGDPLVSGIATTLINKLGTDRVTVVPHVSSVALARARLGWSAESVSVISVVGRDVSAVLRECAPGMHLLVLSSDEHTPGELADLLQRLGYGNSRMVILSDLGGTAESRIETTAQQFVGAVPRLNIVALEIAGPLRSGWATGLPDELFDNDGQLTKRDLRAAALARLAPVPGQLLWDVGAGAGSVGIEWMRAHPSCRTIAVEADADRARRIVGNAHSLGVPTLRVVNGSAPNVLADLEEPDAIFVGGGATRPGVLDECMSRLSSGGRLVIHGVTLETEMLLGAAYLRHGGELTRIHIERAAPVGTFVGWTPARAVTQWAWVKN
ncbi:precorrin-6y C5,15-methyltransferase (decarboxylating) subunit CbiE [Mycobacterium sp. MS1601]|uniref:precorrin-6y C5,15-methyltransferase (decarboxylating) subunit CbiE n=1 Tax=Mycobacterium sp. MS1601 TaxID=1936029 RepID=UPI0009FA772E|nr:precorrin-6y C5,15-methyltransferase (decarboxylating) subunit CbiE [Mycobacterium sp. MS1601]